MASSARPGAARPPSRSARTRRSPPPTARASRTARRSARRGSWPRSAPRRPSSASCWGSPRRCPATPEAALLVDLARNAGDQYLSMKVVRAAAKHGYVLPERGYPLHPTPGAGGVETAYVLGITRQESGFDPHVRSPAGAAGMMQLMPAHRPHPLAQVRLRRRRPGRRQLQHAAGRGLPRPADGPVRRLVRDGDRGLQRRPGSADRMDRLLRRPADVVGRSGRLHRVHSVLRDARLRDAGDGGDAGLSRAARRRDRQADVAGRPEAWRLWLRLRRQRRRDGADRGPAPTGVSSPR